MTVPDVRQRASIQGVIHGNLPTRRRSCWTWRKTIVGLAAVGLVGCSGSSSNAATTRDPELPAITTTTKAGAKPSAGESVPEVSVATTTLPAVPAGTTDPCTLLTTDDFSNSNLPFGVISPVPGVVPNGSNSTDPTCLWHSTGDGGYVLLRVRSDGSAGHDREMTIEPRSQKPITGIGEQAFAHANTEVVSVKAAGKAFTIQVAGAQDNTGTAIKLAKVVAANIVK